jgi:hypothetical protein
MNNPWQDISFLTPRLKALQQRCDAGDYSGAQTEDDKRLIFARYQVDRGYLTEDIFDPTRLDRAA